MHPGKAIGLVVFGVIICTAGARADLVITLEPKDADLNPIVGEVPVGSGVFVDLLLSVDGDDVPLPDIRNLQFDFAATSSSIELGIFTWEVESSAYGFQIHDLPPPQPHH